MSIDRTSGTSSTVVLLQDENTIAEELGGDIGARVTALLLEQSHDAGEANREIRHEVEERLRASEDDQVAKMHEKANETRQAGWFEGGGQMAEGACGMAAGASSGRMPQIWKGLGEGAAGGGKVLGSLHQAHGHDVDADATAAGHRSEEAKRTLDDLRDARKESSDTEQKALNMLSNLRKTEDSTYQAALLQRA